MKNSTLLSLISVSVIAACGGNSSNSGNNPMDTKPTSDNGDSSRVEKTPSSPQPQKPDVAAKESFLKTFAAGKKNFSHKNVKLEYIKKEMRSGKEKEQWAGSCASKYNFTLKGQYPTVNLSFGGITCDRKDFFTLYALESIMMELSYGLIHIPQTSLPNQFRLVLQEVRSSRKWRSYEAVNSLIRDDLVQLDFLGKEEEMIGTTSTHYLTLQLKKDTVGRIHMTVDYLNNDEGRREVNELKISTELD
ncbi:MAG: hypothetical protein A4S09_12965 [Proteobacteria bacterium SG_bin7]|nr:MAG: hypothetical protein A4S09_12965 [Proteobacteria bacterium SG_bin7]